MLMITKEAVNDADHCDKNYDIMFYPGSNNNVLRVPLTSQLHKGLDDSVYHDYYDFQYRIIYAPLCEQCWELVGTVVSKPSDRKVSVLVIVLAYRRIHLFDNRRIFGYPDCTLQSEASRNYCSCSFH